MGLLFHHVQGCQKAPAIVRHTDISQKKLKTGFCKCKRLKKYEKNQGNATKVMAAAHHF